MGILLKKGSGGDYDQDLGGGRLWRERAVLKARPS
jgi:hypothetical protein